MTLTTSFARAEALTFFFASRAFTVGTIFATVTSVELTDAENV